ncbi:MAG: amphi-Trp domain-containing protein [Nitrospinae bacterium]|nr:amphi-Trp domain-containing protein [Nitrospinota bacterium]
MSKKEVEVKGNMDLKTAIGHLEELVASFKAGTVCIQNGSEFVTLKPKPAVTFEMEASRKKGKEKLSLEIGWMIEKMPVEENPSLKISSKEPEQVKVETLAGEGSKGGEKPGAAAKPAR